MLRQKNRFSLRAKLVAFAAVVLISSLTALAFHRGRLFRSPQPQQQPVPVIASYFNPAGMPVRIAVATAGTDKGATSLNYSITNASGAEISSLDLVLFDFDPTGKLMKSQAWNLSRNGQQPVDFERGSRPGRRRCQSKHGHRLAGRFQRIGSNYRRPGHGRKRPRPAINTRSDENS
jgi:hypothetical protein